MSSLADLSEQVFDVLVIGGGIHGAAAAWAISRQGCSVALIEQGDFGGAASANSQKIIHGGLRYLQQLDLKRMRDSIVARKRSFQLLPHLTHPAAFMVPTEGFFLRSKAALLAAFMINDTISFDRNWNVPATHHLGMGRVKSRSFLQSVSEGLARQGTGAGIWFDGFAESTERFTLAFVLTAEKHGALIRNYTRADKLHLESGAACGCEATDMLTGQTFPIRARQVVVATGGWLDSLSGGATGAPPHGSWTRAYNIVVKKRFFGDYGVGLETIGDYPDEHAVLKRGKRNYFFAPWRNGTIIGTMYQVFHGSPGDCGLTPGEIQRYLDEINTLYPDAALSLSDVTFAHAGILPSRKRGDGSPGSDPAKDTVIVDAARSGGARGLFYIRGVKYTTAVQVGEQIARRVLAHAGKRSRKGLNEQVIGAEHLVNFHDLRKAAHAANTALPDSLLEHHLCLYGDQAPELIALCAENKSWAESLGPGHAVLGADVIHAVRREHARTLSDIVFRRTDLGTFAYPGDVALRHAGELMRGELDWNPDRLASEIRAVEDVYRKMGVAHTLKD